MKKTSVIELNRQAQSFDDPLTDAIRSGARKILTGIGEVDIKAPRVRDRKPPVVPFVPFVSVLHCFHRIFEKPKALKNGFPFCI